MIPRGLAAILSHLPARIHSEVTVRMPLSVVVTFSL
jgi:hypothetical protein